MTKNGLPAAPSAKTLRLPKKTNNQLNLAWSKYFFSRLKA